MRESPPAYVARREARALAQDELPVEVLHHIFAHIPITTPCEHKDFPAHLVPIHVCRAWRFAALSCADLWTCAIPLNNTALTILALERAKTWHELLSISAPPGSYADPCALPIALGEPSRIAELTCPATRESHGIIREAAHLRSLSIWQDQHNVYSEGGHILFYGDYRGADVFGGTARLRMLKELRLHGNDVLTSASLLRDLPLLTTLELTLPGIVWPTLASLFAALRTLPLLQSLALRNGVLPPMSIPIPGLPSPETSISLSHLKQLCLTGIPGVISCMLHYLSIPRCTRLSLMLTVEAEFQNGIWDIHRRMDTRLVDIFRGRLLDDYPLQHLSLRVYDRAGERLDYPNMFWRSPSHCRDLLTHFPYLRTLDLRFGIGESGTGGDPISLPILTHLHISAPPHLLSATSAFIRAPQTAYRSYSVLVRHLHELTPDNFVGIERILRLPALTYDGDEDAAFSESSYTRLDITPARDNPAGGFRLVASDPVGADADFSPAVVDISVEERGILGPYKACKYAQWPHDYGRALDILLSVIPLGALDQLSVADGTDRIYGHPDVNDTVFAIPAILDHLARARVVNISFYASAVYPFLEAAHRFERLEHISLRSMTIGEQLAGIKLLPRLSTSAKSPRILVSVADCAIAERDLLALQSWAGSDNFDWDERDVVDWTPSWGVGDSPWLVPDAREVRFWRPELWEKRLCAPEVARTTMWWARERLGWDVSQRQGRPRN